jgi:superfamily II DNA or RNA helicase
VLTLEYEDGTVVVRADGEVPELPYVETAPDGSLRAPGYRYAGLKSALDALGADYADRVRPEGRLAVASDYALREYQREALDAWTAENRRGVLELPTGSGKTVIGVKAIEAIGEPTLVVVPTIDLLNQWRAELADLDVPVGQLGGDAQVVEDLTVATYDSAYLRADELGDRFSFLVFDECHHLGGEGYRDIARLFAAPSRLGLTATFERPDGAHEVIEELVGPVVYELDADDLAGEHLAPYDIRRLEVPLTDAERAEYEDAQETFVSYLRNSDVQLNSGADYQQLVKRSGSDPRAREALLAKQRAREIVAESDAKVEALEGILERHRGERTIVFTASTDLVYRLSERFLMPAITHETGSAERRETLTRFREGTYSRVVTANVLDEGVDVPDANVAVVIAGSGSEREFTQRLGRILRPKAEGERATLYELVSEDTAEERVAERRR